MGRRLFQQDEEGISVVVGAMLVLAVVITIAATVRASIVPNMEADAEAAHMRALTQQLIGLRSDMQRQIELEQSTILSHSLQMGRQKVGVFDSGQSPDRIGLIFPDERLQVNSSVAIVDDPSAGASEIWASGAKDITNVKEVSSLRLRLDKVEKAMDGGGATIEVKTSSGAFRGCLRILIEDFAASDYYVVLETYDRTATTCLVPASPPVNKEIRAYHQGNAFTNYFIDALDPAFRFDRVLKATPPPYTITIGYQGLVTGSHAIQYVAHTSSGPGVPMGGGGITQANYLKKFSGGYLEYEATNRHYVAQTYRIEHGALILQQPQGEVFRVPPDMRIDLIPGFVGIVATIPSLQGDARTLASQSATVVQTSLLNKTRVSLIASEMTLTIDTQHPQLWKQFFESSLQKAFAGLTPSANGPFYKVTSTAGTVVVTINGPTVEAPCTPLPPLITCPTPTNDVRLLLHQAHLNVKLNP